MREIEVKAVVDDWDHRRSLVVAAGGRLAFEGRLQDRRYDTPARLLTQRDEVLRLRVHSDGDGERAELGWKGPTGYVGGYKVRDELATGTTDPEVLDRILSLLGYEITREIDRDIAQYDLDGTVVRFERYPRMDDLVEVEGHPAGIERAIATLGIERSSFTSERLPDFVRRYQLRTGLSAALCQGEMEGRVHYDLNDA